MAYDRTDMRRGGRPSADNRFDHPSDRERSWSDRDRDERGFFERAGDEIASWFGDDEPEQRRPRDERMSNYGRTDMPARFSERDREPGRFYRPLAGDYGRSEQPRGLRDERGPSRGRDEESRWGGSVDRSDRSQLHDPHYAEWRRRQVEDLDRDYDEYRREHQSKFESDFANWRQTRQTKRQMLGQMRPDMAVVGSDGEPVGTVARTAGDRLILAKSDPEAGGSHHSLPCTAIDRIEENRVVLGFSADQAREQWRDDSRERALFEREDQGEAGPHMLDRSFSGTYR